MAYSIVTHPGDGSTTTFPINFTLGFISRDDVRCRVGSEVDGLGDPVYRALTWITDGLVQVQGAPAALGVNVEFTRTVNKDKLIHDYSDGTAITESNLDDSNKQVIMLVHEFLDNRVQVTPTQSVNMNSQRITNVADGIDPTDAVTMQQAGQAITLTPIAVQAASDAVQAASDAAAALIAAEAAATSATGVLANAMLKSQNLNDVADKPTARTNLDVYSKAESLPASTVFDNAVQDFRLTLQNGIPIPTANVVAGSTLYCCPYKGNKISLYAGGAWVTRSSEQFSLDLSGLTSGKPYDVFCYDNAGVPTLLAVPWLNDSDRNLALTRLDGVLVQDGWYEGRYLGTFYTTGTTTTEDSSKKRYLWNYYNRVDRVMNVYDATASWTYTTATYRQANGNAANKIEFIVGVSEDPITVVISQDAVSNTASQGHYNALGLDSITVAQKDFFAVVAGVNFHTFGSFSSVLTPVAGKHYVAWLEKVAQALGTSTWYGTTTCGLTGVIKG